MKSYIIFVTALFFLLSACGSSRKAIKSSEKTDTAVMSSGTELISETTAESPIIEVEEKLVAINDIAPEPFNYFVIIGSFRNPDNARNYQKQIENDGFSSELLKNDAGLYRVSVMASNNILAAREEIKQIREKFHKYSDTWLLIQKK
jgi:cell division protein FtsN